MIALVLLSLILAATATLCDPAVTNPQDLDSDSLGALFKEFETARQRNADNLVLPREYNDGSLTKAEYVAVVSTYFGDVTLSAEVNATIDAEVNHRFQVFITDELASLNAAQKILLAACVDARVNIIQGALAIYRGIVDAIVTTKFGIYVIYRNTVDAYFAALASAAADSDTVQIATEAIRVEGQRQIARFADAEIYANIRQRSALEQASQSLGVLNDYFKNISLGVAADADAVKAAIRVVIVAGIELDRALWINGTYVRDQADQRRQQLEANLNKLKNDIATIIWANVVADIRARFDANDARVRAELALALEHVQCDVTNAVVTVTGEDASLTITFTGLDCYSTDSEADVKAFICGSLKAYFVSDVGVASADAYSCAAATSAKRSAQATAFEAAVTASDPSTGPEPPTGSGSSIFAGLLLLLVSVFFHF